MGVIAIGVVVGILATDGSDGDNGGKLVSVTSPSTTAQTGNRAPADRGAHSGSSGRRGGGDESGSHGPRFKHTAPAIMIKHPEPLLSEMEMPKVTNGWTVGSHNETTTVVAGNAPGGSDGAFAIYRFRIRPYEQGTNLVKVPGAGSVKITKAPLGPKVVARAQKRGTLDFAGQSGVTGMLHLKNDTVTVSP